MEKQVTVKNIVNFRAMKYFYMYNLKSKRFVLIYIIFASLCIALAGVAFAIPLIRGEAVDWFLPAALAAFSIYLLYTILTIEKKIDANIANHFQSRRPSEQLVTITEEAITVAYASDPNQSVTFDWVQVTRIHEIAQYYYLFAGKQLILIDRDVNALVEGDRETLDAIIKEKIAVKPYKKFEKELVTKPITFVHPDIIEDETQAHEAETTDVSVEASDEAPDEQLEEQPADKSADKSEDKPEQHD